MAKFLLDETGNSDHMSEGEATVWVHTFVTAVYFPLLGSLLADAFLGKYKTIIGLSVVYCLGHLWPWTKPKTVDCRVKLNSNRCGWNQGCVSAHVGDQFGRENSGLLEKIYGWFYLSINLGAFASTLLTPWLLENYGAAVAFGVPGLLMLIATLVFWAGRNDFAHIPARGLGL